MLLRTTLTAALAVTAALVVAPSTAAAPAATSWDTLAEVGAVKGMACRNGQDDVAFRHNAKRAGARSKSKSTYLYQSDAIFPEWEKFPGGWSTGWVKGGNLTTTQAVYSVPEGVNRFVKIVVKVKGGDKEVGTHHVDDLIVC